MPRKLEDFTPAERAVIDHLYSFTGLLSFSDYLEGQYDQELDRCFLEMMQNGKPIAPSAEVFDVMIRRVLNQHHPDPESILNASLAHRAHAGLKGLVVEACEVFVPSDTILEHLLAEIDASAMTDEQAADLVVKVLINQMLSDQDKTTPSNPYAAQARWEPHLNGPEEDLPKSLIWELVHECLWGGVVGVTEQMSDVLARGRYAVAWRICRSRQRKGRKHIATQTQPGPGTQNVQR